MFTVTLTADQLKALKEMAAAVQIQGAAARLMVSIQDALENAVTIPQSEIRNPQ